MPSTTPNTTAVSNMFLANQRPPINFDNPFYVRERNLTLGLLGVVLNSITFMALVRHQDLNRSLRGVLCSLVTTDLGFCFNSVVITVITSLRITTMSCKITMCINVVFVDCTALILLVISLDRLLAVHRASWYKQHIDSWAKAILSALVPWIAAMALSIASFVSPGDSRPPCPIFQHVTPFGNYLQGGLFLFACIFVLFSYASIGVRLTSGCRRPVVYPSFQAGGAGGVSITPSDSRRIRRVTVHTSVLAAWFLIVYLPLAYFFIATQTEPHTGWARIDGVFNMFVTSALMLNSLLNPVLFFWRLVDFKSL